MENIPVPIVPVHHRFVKMFTVFSDQTIELIVFIAGDELSVFYYFRNIPVVVIAILYVSVIACKRSPSVTNSLYQIRRMISALQVFVFGLILFPSE